MINLELLEKYKIKYDWKTLYVGIHFDFINMQELVKYAEKVLTIDNNVNNDFINDLAWGIDGLLKNELLSKMIEEFKLHDFENTDQWNNEIRNLRYCMLKDAFENKDATNRDILDKVSEIYADVGYPVEMETFIPYMPAKDGYTPSSHTQEENILRLMKLFESFLKKEELELL